MKRKKYFKTYKAIIVVLGSVLVFNLFFTEKANANFEKGTNNNCGFENKTNSSASDNSEGGMSEDWTKEGSKPFNIAKDLWDAWKARGYSGSAIAGVLGNIAHEGGFNIPDRAEGHFGNDSATNGLSAGVVPSVGSGYPTGKTGKPEGGGGHYQFTPYSKYADIGDSKWLDSKAQSDFVWESEAKNASWGREYAQSTDVSKAVGDWFKYYERGASLNPAKIDSAKQAYKLFGGENVSFDSSLYSNSKDKDTSGNTNNNKSDKFSYCEFSSKSNGPKENIVDDALSLLGYFTYLQAHGVSYIGGDIKNPKKSGTTDCSGFVWLVLARLGYQVPENMMWFTGTMAEDAKGEKKWLEEIKPTEAKAGDIIIANVGGGSGNDGHTAFLTEDYHGNDTKIVQSGGEGNGSVCEGTIGNSFGHLLKGEVVFARAIKNTK